MMKITLSLASLLVYISAAQAQNELFIQNGGSVHVVNQAGTLGQVAVANAPTLYVGGEIVNNGILVNFAGEIQVAGDFTNNNSFTTTGDDVFVGNTPASVNGQVINTNGFNHLIINKAAQTLVTLNADAEVKSGGTLNFSSGGIIDATTNSLYVLEASSGSVLGFDAPNATGIYSDDRYVIGTLIRETQSGQSYTFPIGDGLAGERYNPLVLDFNVGGNTAITSRFYPGDPGVIVYSGNANCAANNYIIVYSDMTGEGWWQLDATGSFDYDVNLHPNLVNNNSNPNVFDGQYRALRGDIANAGGTWNAVAAVDGDECVVSNTYYSIPGVGYSGNLTGVYAPAGGYAALPVELLDIAAQPVENRLIRVLWTTATEQHLLGYHVERSVDGIEFENIGFVAAAHQAQLGEHDYSFDDVNAQPNTIYYYRLLMEDVDGTTNYSPIVAASLTADENTLVSLFPNPTASGNATLTVNTPVSGTYRFSVFNAVGQQLISQDVELVTGFNAVNIPSKDWAAGTYLIVLNNDQERFALPLVVLTR